MAIADLSHKPMTVTLASEAATRALAARLAGLARRGDVIALQGDLGAGKTSFARGFINALPPLGATGPGATGRRTAQPGAEEVPSPTFTLVQTYERTPAPVWHFDLYRLNAPEEAFELGLEEALAEAISLIEWPERLGPLLPAARLDVKLAFAAAPEQRLASLRGGGDWPRRLSGLRLTGLSELDGDPLGDA
jgi:tRNA threonylcarbamoyladenosine biosynthesis protein TsaE